MSRLFPATALDRKSRAAVVACSKAPASTSSGRNSRAGASAVERARHGPAAGAARLDPQNKIALKGPITTPVGEGFTCVNVGLRKTLDLYANLRPVSNLPRCVSRFQNVDLVIVRENTEDLYAGLEHMSCRASSSAIKIITEKASTRIARSPSSTRARRAQAVTAVHKANIMKLSDGLFLECFRKVAREYPRDRVRRPDRRQPLHAAGDAARAVRHALLENLYGDIVSDLCAGLVGGLGVVPGANIGETWRGLRSGARQAPDIAGQNIANPTALLAVRAHDVSTT